MRTTNPYSKFLGPEDHIQIQVCNYAKAQYPGVAIHHSPNAGKRSRFEQYKLKVLGVSAGFPDLVLCWKNKTIAPELKTEKGKATPNQLAWIDVLNRHGIPAKVCKGFDEAKAFIDEHFRNL